MAVFFLDAKYFPENKNVFGIKNRAFNYGDGLFDSIFCKGGEPLLFGRHWKRVMHGLSVLKMELPEKYSQQFVFKTICILLKKNKLTEAKIRINIFRTEGGLYTPQKNNVSVLMTSHVVANASASFNSRGKRMMLCSAVAKPVTPFSSFKNCNSMVYVLAGIEREKAGYDDCLILNNRNKVCEALHSNIFFVKNKVVFTPAVSQGCIEGVMRNEIISTLRKNKIKVKEGIFSVADIKQADEIFTTNAVERIVPVKEFMGSKNYKTTFTKTLFEILENRG